MPPLNLHLDYCSTLNCMIKRLLNGIKHILCVSSCKQPAAVCCCVVYPTQLSFHFDLALFRGIVFNLFQITMARNRMAGY